MCGLAVPARGAAGETIAAINVSLPTGQFTCESAVAQFLGELRLTASRLRASAAPR
ncbi:hypothetical protein J7E70_26310 [Variovorax paradoxus]|nr:hypothetical protein [Variovorax paradoxus]